MMFKFLRNRESGEFMVGLVGWSILAALAANVGSAIWFAAEGYWKGVAANLFAPSIWVVYAIYSICTWIFQNRRN